ncbi:hypothetical protein Nepgr_012974 [Nepenthes gracilis]|uniref:Small auxin up regulated protein n=1 Tax=Nepenthes gracilis TaxID=150966 RepID=A0AAD3SH22_NEPGR|nr:hypothetical protein Nepgr_012974 [Nepenthes gracilis]
MVFIKTTKIIASRICGKNDSSSSPLHYLRLSTGDYQSQKGYVPVIVGDHEGMAERFMIRTQWMKHPSILALLDLSADEFGYDQEGVLQIPCEPEFFRVIIKRLSKRR